MFLKETNNLLSSLNTQLYKKYGDPNQQPNPFDKYFTYNINGINQNYRYSNYDFNEMNNTLILNRRQCYR